MVRSWNFVTTSPTLMPALSAAEPDSTVATSAPTENPEAEEPAALGLTLTPSCAVRGLAVGDDLLGHPLGVVDRDAEAHADVAAVLPVAESPPAEAMATLTPMISPFVLTSAPPELPGLMAASVWMTLMEMDALVGRALGLAAAGGRELEALVTALGVVRAVLRRGRGRHADGAVQGGDDAVSDGAGQAQRGADGDGGVADVELARVAQRCRGPGRRGCRS